MEKSPAQELSKITDYFSPDKDTVPVRDVKDCSKDLPLVPKDHKKLEDILLTPESSPIKEKETTLREFGDVKSTCVKQCKVKTALVKEGTECDHAESESIIETKEQESPPSDRQPDTASSDRQPNTKSTDGQPDETSTVVTKTAPLTPKLGSGRSGKKKRGKKSAATSSIITVQSAAMTSSPIHTRPKSSRRKKADPAANNHVLTDYFPVRRSGRQCISQIKKTEQSRLEDAILNSKEEGLEVIELGEKGRGVVATRSFHRGEFVVEYAGDLIDLTSAKERETKYAASPNDYGCYMYYFTHKNKNYCIDATLESDKLGRLLNHSKKGNCHTKLIDLQDRPYLILVASKDIQSGEELLYDYGDRSKTAIDAHPWLAS